MALRPITFLGDSLDCLRAFPEDARRHVGYELYKVQQGLDPSDWKPMSIIGPGAREIRIREVGGAYRVLYVAMLGERVYVLNVFQKKSQKTPGRELDLAAHRLKLLKQRTHR